MRRLLAARFQPPRPPTRLLRTMASHTVVPPAADAPPATIPPHQQTNPLDPKTAVDVHTLTERVKNVNVQPQGQKKPKKEKPTASGSKEVGVSFLFLGGASFGGGLLEELRGSKDGLKETSVFCLFEMTRQWLASTNVLYAAQPSQQFHRPSNGSV